MGIDLALASEQKSPPGQQMMSVKRPMFGVARPSARSSFHRSNSLACSTSASTHVLLVGAARLAEAVALGQVGDGIELLVGDVAGGDAGDLQRQGHGAVARLLVRHHVARAPAGEARVLGIQRGQRGALVFQGLVGGVDEVRGDAVQFRLGQGGRAVLEVRPLGGDALGEDFRGQRLDQDLDPRLVLVVTATVTVVHAQEASDRSAGVARAGIR